MLNYQPPQKWVEAFLCIVGSLISTLHLQGFYYSHDAPKWFIFDIGLSIFIFLLSINKKNSSLKLGYIGTINLALITLMIGSLLWAPNVYAGAEFTIRYTLASLFGLLLITSFSREQLCELFIKVVICSAFVFCIVLLIERYILFLPRNVGTYTPIGFQNNAGHVFNIWIPVLSFLFIKNIKRPIGYFYLSILVVLVYVLIEAATRGAIVGLFLGELLVFCLLLKQNRKLALRFLTVTALMVTTLAITQNIEVLRSEKLASKISLLNSGINAASGQRISMFSNTIDMTLDNPIGIGVNNFEYIHPKYANVGDKEKHSPFVNERQILKTPHNYFLKITSELGLLGGLLTLALYLSIFIIAIRNAYIGGMLDKWLLVALVAVLFHSLVSGVFLNPTSLFFSVLLFAFILKQGKKSQRTWRFNFIPLFNRYQIAIIPILSMMWLSSHYYAFQGIKSFDAVRLEQALKINPGNERAWYDLSRVQYQRFRNTRSSLESIQQFVTLYPYHIQGLYIQAQRQIELKQYRDAQYTVTRLLTIHPNYQQAKQLKHRLKLLLEQ